ncbi:MAG TPA: hypothetical protein VH394_17055, partial [Thermoanaerobaculia bacterium]|nr:hypothetical protein [Thermoanaerobaculia bacterium]
MFSIPWYEKPLILFALLYPALGIVMARRRLASGHGSVVTLATLPLTIGAVTFWLGLPAAAEGGIRLSSFSNTDISGVSGAAMLLFVTCLSTLLVLAGTLPYRIARGDEG